jgi:hypothetical protein
MSLGDAQKGIASDWTQYLSALIMSEQREFSVPRFQQDEIQK